MHNTSSVCIYLHFKRANCKQVQVQCTQSVTRARGPFCKTQSLDLLACGPSSAPAICATRPRPKQTKSACRREMHLLVSQGPNVLKNPPVDIEKRIVTRSGPIDASQFISSAAARDRLFIIYSTCMHICRQGSAVNARVVY